MTSSFRRKARRGGVAACLLICTLLAACGSAEKTAEFQGKKDIKGPLAVTAFLQKNPEWRLVGADDIPGELREEFLKAHYESTAVGDTNGDGKEDVVAALVRIDNGQRSFAVAAFHGEGGEGRGDADPHWVVRGTQHYIAGVAFAEDTHSKRLMIWPLDCFNCDGHGYYRWSGEAYEFGIKYPNEQSCIGSDTAIHAAPDAGSPILKRSQKNVINAVIVLDIGKKTESGSRWQKVRPMNVDMSSGTSIHLKPFDPDVVGYMDSKGFDDGVGCPAVAAD